MVEQKKIKINIPPDRAEARYSDFAVIAKNTLGFNFDFGQRMPGENTINIVSRVAMSPQHAKIFSEILSRNVQAYEKNFGEIKIPKAQVGQDASDEKTIHFVR